MRVLVAGLAFLAAAVALAPTPAPASSACTAWLNYDGSTEQCIGFILQRTRGAGLKSDLSGDTLYFWFDNNVVMARCVGTHSMIMLATYHTEDDSACGLQDKVQNALEQ